MTTTARTHRSMAGLLCFSSVLRAELDAEAGVGWTGMEACRVVIRVRVRGRTPRVHELHVIGVRDAERIAGRTTRVGRHAAVRDRTVPARGIDRRRAAQVKAWILRLGEVHPVRRGISPL